MDVPKKSSDFDFTWLGAGKNILKPADYDKLMEIASAPDAPWVQELTQKLSPMAKQISVVMTDKLAKVTDDALKEITRSGNDAAKTAAKLMLSGRPKSRKVGTGKFTLSNSYTTKLNKLF